MNNQIRNKNGLMFSDLRELMDRSGQDMFLAVGLDGVDTHDSRIVSAHAETNAGGEPGGVLWLSLPPKLREAASAACHGEVVAFNGRHTLRIGGGTITLAARDGTGTCRSRGIKEQGRRGEDPDARASRLVCNAAIDGLESLLLALVTAGAVDPRSEAVREAVETALDAIGNAGGLPALTAQALRQDGFEAHPRPARARRRARWRGAPPRRDGISEASRHSSSTRKEHEHGRLFPRPDQHRREDRPHRFRQTVQRGHAGRPRPRMG